VTPCSRGIRRPAVVSVTYWLLERDPALLSARLRSPLHGIRIVGGVLRDRLEVVEDFSDFVFLFSEADSPESSIEKVPDGVAAAVDGMLAVPVATDAGPLRVSVELHDGPPPLQADAGEDAGVLTWRPLGQRLRLGDTWGNEVDGLALGAGDEVLAVEVRCRGRDEANRAGTGGIEEPVEEIIVRLWPGPAAGADTATRRSGFARVLAGEPPPASGPAAPLALGDTVVVPVHYHGFYLRDEGVAAPWEWRENMLLCSARVNGLVSNLPGLARVTTGTQTGEVDLCVRAADRRPATAADALATASGPRGLPATADAVAVTHRTSGSVLIADIEDKSDHYRFEVPAGDTGLLAVAWDRDGAARRRRNAKARERIDLVFWTGEIPGELVIQAASTFGREMAADDERIRQQLLEPE
jgi:hypothetical protein